MWLGPPYMNRKMTLLALAGSIGGLGASGLTNAAGAAVARLPKNPSADNRPVSAAAPKPAPVSHRNSRRVRRQNWRAGSGCVMAGRSSAASGGKLTYQCVDAGGGFQGRLSA